MNGKLKCLLLLNITFNLIYNLDLFCCSCQKAVSVWQRHALWKRCIFKKVRGDMDMCEILQPSTANGNLLTEIFVVFPSQTASQCTALRSSDKPGISKSRIQIYIYFRICIHPPVVPMCLESTDAHSVLHGRIKDVVAWRFTRPDVCTLLAPQALVLE